MAFVCVDKDGTEWVFEIKPHRVIHRNWEHWEHWEYPEAYYASGCEIELPKGSIAKLIGRELTWKDEPVELIK